MKVGFFDSGHGGLDFLREALQNFPSGAPYEWFYYGDILYLPYGSLDDSVLIERCRHICQELIAEGCQVIVVACNTATAYAIDKLRQEFSVPFVGVEPYLNYINIAPRSCLEHNQVAALVTPNTAKSGRILELKSKLDPDNKVPLVPMPELAGLIEKAIVSKNVDSLKFDLAALLSSYKEKQWSHIILGCTHYPLVGAFIEELTGWQVISPTKAVIDQLGRVCAQELLIVPKQFHQIKDNSFQYKSTDDKEWQSKVLVDLIPWW